MARKFWDIKYYDTGASTWVADTKIPRAGLQEFSRTKETSIEFVELADASEAKLSSETKSKWRDITLVFPKQVVTETVKDQLLGYINNEKGIQITIPILTGSSSYTEKVIEGYATSYEENWILDKKNNQKFVIKLNVKEFDVG